MMLKYKSYYVYDFETESIHVAEGNDHEAACKLYAQMTENRFEHDDDRWAFDIALDCIRKMLDVEYECIKRDGKIPDFHSGYGMYVRNKYIHPSKLHRFVIADNVSSTVEKFIYSILMEEEQTAVDVAPAAFDEIDANQDPESRAHAIKLIEDTLDRMQRASYEWANARYHEIDGMTSMALLLGAISLNEMLAYNRRALVIRINKGRAERSKNQTTPSE